MVLCAEVYSLNDTSIMEPVVLRSVGLPRSGALLQKFGGAIGLRCEYCYPVWLANCNCILPGNHGTLFLIRV